MALLAHLPDHLPDGVAGGPRPPDRRHDAPRPRNPRRHGGWVRLLPLFALVAGAAVVLPAPPASAAPVIDELSTGITSSDIRGVTLGPDGNVWFTEYDKDKIGRMTPTGEVTEFSAGITPGAGPTGIVAGPDGQVWFTETGKDRIGRISPTGEVQEFSIGIALGSMPLMITVGPDQSLWFTETNADRIGRITTDGTVTEFATGISANSGLRGITAGPDGNVWFTELDGNRIGRITPLGVVTQFSAGLAPGAKPDHITTGPDGNLWFAARGGAVGRITPGGAITSFSGGVTGGSQPSGITAGPDGNLWFSERTGNRVGKVSTTGSVTEYSSGISAGSQPGALTVGPDGNVWFVEGVGRLGRVGNFPGARFHPLTPVRLLDSRTAAGGWNGKLFAANPRTVKVAGNGLIPASATSVVLNITVTEGSLNSFLTVYPDGQAPPNASNINFAAGQTIPNSATVRVGTSGRIAFANARGKVHVVVDAVGYYDPVDAAGSRINAVNPKRLLDSRTTVGGWNAKLAAGDANVRTLQVAGVSGVPADATAVVVNVTATNPSAGSFLEVWPSGQARPTASNLNMAPGETIANLVTVAVGANGRVSFYNAVGSTHVVADLVGWYGATGNTYHALGAPNRVLDDRADIGFSGPFGAGFSGFVKVAGFTAVPAGAKGVVMNTTVTNGTAPSFLTVWPVGPAQPNASTINFSANQTIANLAMPALSNGGVLQIANANGTVDVIGDVTGYLAP